MAGYDEDKNAMVESATAITDLTAATGTADNTVADVGAEFSQTTLNNNFKDIATKVNAILAALRSANIIPLD